MKVDELEIALFDSGVMVPDGAYITGLGERSKLVTGLSQEQIIYLSDQIDKLRLKLNGRVIRSRPFVAGTPVPSMNVNTDQEEDKDKDNNMASPTLRQQPESSETAPSASTTEPSIPSKIPGLPQTDIANAKKREERRKRKGKKKEEKKKAREAVMERPPLGGMPGLVNSGSSTDSEGNYSDDDDLYTAPIPAQPDPVYNASSVSSTNTLSKFNIGISQPKSDRLTAEKRNASSPADQNVPSKRVSAIPQSGQSMSIK